MWKLFYENPISNVLYSSNFVTKKKETAVWLYGYILYYIVLYGRTYQRMNTYFKTCI